ncbi:MAG: hypothetical protein JSS40_03935 [Proteobacteria bacterium]|nr:hypothetical protein [Pseudomonadota bacterium]
MNKILSVVVAAVFAAVSFSALAADKKGEVKSKDGKAVSTKDGKKVETKATKEEKKK